jgi:hypothetical protein
VEEESLCGDGGVRLLLPVAFLLMCFFCFFTSKEIAVLVGLLRSMKNCDYC